MARAVIITSYVEYPLDIKSMLRLDDEVVCLDGGYDIAMEQNIQPNVLMGDLDSLATNPDTIRALFAASADRENALRIMQYPTDKDFTDLELALKNLDPEEYPELLIVGGIGGRLDQTAVNLQMIARYTAGSNDKDSSQGFRVIEMMDGRNRCFAVRSNGTGFCTIPAQRDVYLSLIPMSEKCTGVSLTGVKYPLEKATLHRGASLAVSNEFADDVAKLSVEEGALLVICSRR